MFERHLKNMQNKNLNTNQPSPAAPRQYRRCLMNKWTRLILGTVMAGFLLLGPAALAADTTAAGPAGDQVSSSKAIGLSIAAALSVGMSILGAGYAVGRIGSAAIGAIAEKPELLPRAMLFVALGEGLAVLGFAFAIWLLLRM
jgi:V/A-type H+-transporting ATPase subunit K